MYYLRMTRARAFAFACAAGIATSAAGAAPSGPEVDRAKLADACERLLSYEWGKPREAFNVIDEAIAASRDDPALHAELESLLVAVVEKGKAHAGRDIACRKLSRVGTARSVDALGGLLADEKLSHAAVYALERIPDEAAVRALREALPRVTGRLKVGLVNSLGARRDARAVRALIPLLKDADPDLAAAAACALGRIGTRGAARAVVAFRERAPEDMRGAAADACLDAAAGILEAGDRRGAAAIYEKLDAEAEPRHVRIAAFQGLVDALGLAETMPRLVSALTGEDGRAQAVVAARIVRDAPGEEATRACARALATLAPEGQVVMLRALRERADAAARPEVLPLIESADGKVRLAAIEALAALGGVDEIATLAGIAAEGRGAESDAARLSLASLKGSRGDWSDRGDKGEDIDQALVSAMDRETGGRRREIVRALAARKVKAAVAPVLREAEGDDEATRLVALEALGKLADHTHAAALVKLLRSARTKEEKDAAEKALASACSRAGDECADAVAAGLEGADAATRCALVRVLGRAGGKKALAAVRATMEDADAKVREASARALADWPDASALETLLEMAREADRAAHRVLALRGYVRLVRAMRTSDDDKVRRLGEAIAAAGRPEEKLLAIGALGDVRKPSSLRLVMKYLDDPELPPGRGVADGAAASAVKIAGKLRGEKDLVREAMGLVVEKARSRKVVSEARKILKKLK